MAEVQSAVCSRLLHDDLLNPELDVPLGASVPSSKSLQNGDISGTEEHVATGRQAVTSSSANLLAIVLERLRHVEVDDLYALIVREYATMVSSTHLSDIRYAQAWFVSVMYASQR